MAEKLENLSKGTIKEYKFISIFTQQTLITMKLIIVLFCSILLFSCDSKDNTITLNTNLSKQIINAFDTKEGIPVTLEPWGVKVNVNNKKSYKGKVFPTARFNYIEDQGDLYLDIDKATVVSKISSNQNLTYIVIPIEIKPDDRDATMHFLGLFSYNHSTKHITQEGVVILDSHISNISLEDQIQAISIAYTLPNGKINSSQYYVSENQLIEDPSYWLSRRLSKDYFRSHKDSLPVEGSEYKYGSYDLNSDGRQETIVQLTTPEYCGSGGCLLLIYDYDRSLITMMTITKIPIQVLQSATEGYNDLSVYTSGAQRWLRYDGKSYPTNPSMEPTIPTNAVVEKILIQ